MSDSPLEISCTPGSGSSHKLEIAHVLFTDIVGYSKLPMDEQEKLLMQLQDAVRQTSEFARAEAADELIRLPTGDGMALVFFGDAEAPVRCAVEFGRSLRKQSTLQLRMGIHTGPVYRVADINANRNVAGGGINIAQRVMDCGDAGHILVSSAEAEILGQLRAWSSMLHDLGEVEVKHGVRIHIYNLYADEVGNSALPKKVAASKPTGTEAGLKRSRYRGLIRVAVTIVILCAIVAIAFVLRSRFGKSHSDVVHAARRSTVAVLGFKDISGKSDPTISPALSEMIATELTAGGQLRIIPSEQVTHGKKDLALADEDSLGHDTLKRVRSNLGSDYVVLGSYFDTGGQIRVDLRLQDAAAGETIATFSESGTEHDLPDLANRAGEALRHKLGIDDPSADDAGRTKASQSSSLEATKLYSEGLQELHSYNALAARDLLERAIVEDPNYALAHAALAEAWRSLGYNDKSAAEAKKAMDLSSGLSLENRLVIEAQYRNSTHDLVREGEIYKELFVHYPDNLEYGLALARSQYFKAQFQEGNSTLDALQQLPSPEGDDLRIDFTRSAAAEKSGDYKKALTLSERVELRAQQRGARRLSAAALSSQCTLLSRLGDIPKATAACDKSRTIFSDIGDYAGEASVWGQIAFQASNRGDASSGRVANERQIALLKKIANDGGLAWAMTVAGELSASSDDYPSALREYNQALRLYQKVGDQSGVISAYGNLGWVNALQGNLRDAVKNDEEAIALTRQTISKGEMDVWLVDLADVLLEEGDVQSATKRLAEGFEINSETGDKREAVYLHASQSRLLFEQGELDESRREAELAIKLCLESNEQGACLKPPLFALLDIAENRPQTAAEALRKTLSDSKPKSDYDEQTETRAVLIEALLAMPSANSKQEIASLAKVNPNTQNVSSRLAANLQIARARFALGDRAGASQLLTEVITESQQRGYELHWLEAQLAQAEMELQSGDVSTARRQIDQIAKWAEEKGLLLIAKRARALEKNRRVT
jgi:class 3 adenylate cyclase/Tfp pilus assembly protein PilF/TolB-like protein